MATNDRLRLAVAHQLDKAADAVTRLDADDRLVLRHVHHLASSTSALGHVQRAAWELLQRLEALRLEHPDAQPEPEGDWAREEREADGREALEDERRHQGRDA